MYTTNPAGGGSTWHQTWTNTPMQAAPGALAPTTHVPVSPGARSFANPITMTVG